MSYNNLDVKKIIKGIFITTDVFKYAESTILDISKLNGKDKQPVFFTYTKEGKVLDKNQELTVPFSIAVDVYEKESGKKIKIDSSESEIIDYALSNNVYKFNDAIKYINQKYFGDQNYKPIKENIYFDFETFWEDKLKFSTHLYYLHKESNMYVFSTDDLVDVLGIEQTSVRKCGPSLYKNSQNFLHDIVTVLSSIDGGLVSNNDENNPLNKLMKNIDNVLEIIFLEYVKVEE